MSFNFDRIAVLRAISEALSATTDCTRAAQRSTDAFTIVLAGELPDADIIELEEDEADDFDDADLLDDGERIFEAQMCKETATSAEEWCWFRSKNYQALEGWEKLEELQKKIKGSLTD